MKTFKNQSLKILVCLLTLVVLIPACTQTTEKSKVESTVAPPEMDIQTAVMSNNLEVIKQHIVAGSNLDAKEPFNGATPLNSAATFGKTEIAKALIEGGADLSITNNDGSTPLHTAAFFGRVEIVQMLIDAKADKTLKNNYGATPRETVMAPFADMKPIYEMMKLQLEPLGLQLDMNQLEKNLPVVAMMLQ